MVYLWIFLGLIVACVLLGIANIILTKVKKKKLNVQKGDSN